MVEEIETLRLRLRHFTPDDADELYHIYRYPELFKYMSNEKTLSWEQTVGVINSLTGNWKQHQIGVWAVVYKKDRKLLGHCGFKFLENTGKIQIGYLLLPSYWGMGLGTESASAALKYGFEVAKLERVVAVAKPENIASRRVMEKVGMNYEKDAYFYNNDVVYYSISREVYNSNFMTLKSLTKKEDLSKLLRVC